MNYLILSHNFYSDIDSLQTLISTMQFEDTFFGQEIKEFNFIPQGLEKQFEFDLREQTEIQPNTGIFRKPNTLTHIEPFYQHCQWLCIVALEDTKLKIQEKENIRTVFDVENLDDFLINNKEEWITSNEINIKKNDYVFIKPWLWYSLEENKLVQLFLLNQVIEEKE